MKVYYGPTTYTVTGATLLFELGWTDNAFFDGNGNLITTHQLTIPTGNFIIVENVDDSRTGTHDIRVNGQTEGTMHSVVVERGA